MFSAATTRANIGWARSRSTWSRTPGCDPRRKGCSNLMAGDPTTIPAVSRPGPELPASAEKVDRLYRYWRVRVMYSMVTGYALFYFRRDNLPMAAKAIIDEHHFSNTQWGMMLSIATIVYAFSKFRSEEHT